MSWRSLLIQNKAHLSVKNGQVCITNDSGSSTIPAEDIGCVVLESHQVTLTSKLLSHLQNNGVVVVMCDEKHMPNGILMPFHQHHRQTEMAHVQQNWTSAFKKRSWQFIIKHKINNQAQCLERRDRDMARKLKMISGRVKSGDRDNLESYAARLYWPSLFDDFKRGREDAINGALNYGYAIVRACLSRSLVSYGFLPCFGLHHCSTLNGYNLADDLIEMFRPFVDSCVLEIYKRGDLKKEGELTRAHREELCNLLNILVRVGGEEHTLQVSCDKVVLYLSICSRQQSTDELVYPERVGEK